MQRSAFVLQKTSEHQPGYLSQRRTLTGNTVEEQSAGHYLTQSRKGKQGKEVSVLAFVSDSMVRREDRTGLGMLIVPGVARPTWVSPELKHATSTSAPLAFLGLRITQLGVNGGVHQASALGMSEGGSGERAQKAQRAQREGEETRDTQT
eukprot:1464983-Rhodomonas_salina.1